MITRPQKQMPAWKFPDQLQVCLHFSIQKRYSIYKRIFYPQLYTSKFPLFGIDIKYPGFAPVTNETNARMLVYFPNLFYFKGALTRKTLTTFLLVDLVEHDVFSRYPKMRNYYFRFYLSYRGFTVLP